MSLFLRTLILRGILFREQEHREEQGGSMNRSVSRVMVGVAGLAVLGMIATLAGAFAGTAMAQAPYPVTQISEIPDEFVVPEAQNDYLKRIEMIPMRDGVELYTAIIVLKGAKDAPIVLTPTPNNANRPTSLSSSRVRRWPVRTIAGANVCPRNVVS